MTTNEEKTYIKENKVTKLIIGKYQNYKNEELDAYFIALGIPYLARKAIGLTSPLLEIRFDGEMMTIRTTTAIISLENTFKLGEEFEVKFPRGTIRSVATIVSDKEILISSVVDRTGDKCSCQYVFTENELIENLTHENSDVVSKRFYRRVKSET